MNIDGWTGRWLLIREKTHYSSPLPHPNPIEARIRANGLSLWMENDWEMSDGTQLTWRYEGAMDGVMRPLFFTHNGQVLTDIAFYLLDQDFGGDTNRRRDGSQVGCEYWRLEGDMFGVWGTHHLRDGGQYPYHETWRRLT